MFTIEDLRKAYFSHPSIANSGSKDALAKLFLEQVITEESLEADVGLAMEFRGVKHFAYLRETYLLADAIAMLLGVTKKELTDWASERSIDNKRLFRLKKSWTSEEWALAYANFAALRWPGRNKFSIFRGLK